MPKRVIALVLVMLLLCACSTQTPDGEPTPILVSLEQPDSPSPFSQDQPGVPSPVTETTAPALDYTPAVRVSASLEKGYTIIAALDSDWTEAFVYVYADQPVYDVLISEKHAFTDGEPVDVTETGGVLYVPALSAGQAIKLLDPYPTYYDNEYYGTRIAYTNHDGEYEVVVLLGEKENKNPSLLPMEPNLSGKRYDEDYLGNEQFIISDLLAAEFRERKLAGDFDDYVPTGFRIAGGNLGDVNGDDIEDALMYLLTDGRRVAAYTGVMPLFVLIGQPNGGYIVEKKIAEALFSPYRSSSYPVAGNGYIDIVYHYVGGAGCHHTQFCRFWYVPDKNDWLLGAFSYQPSYTFDYEEKVDPAFVRPLPSMSDLPIESLSGGEYYNVLPDWDYFDEVCEFAVPNWDSEKELYTLAVKLDNANGYYEGYIYKYYESLNSGGFIQTIRGEYRPGTKLEVIANAEDSAFIIQGDIWELDEHDSDAFHFVSKNNKPTAGQ